MGIVIGAVAPDFSLPAVGKGIQKGAQISLAAYRGKSKVLLAFYPADFSPVCTSEMRCFREDWEAFRAAGCEILGISSDPLSRHQAFAEQLKLEFPLLSDVDRTVSQQYGVDSLLGTRRAYFLVDSQGILRYQHVEWLPLFKRDNRELLEAVRAIR
ncbi:peroxiredoxin family protein [Thermostichus sp. OS-CIW-31]